MNADVRRIIIIGLTLLLVGFLIYYFSAIVTYVIISWVISMISAPLMDLFLKIKIGKRIKMGRIPAAALTLISIVIGFTFFVWIFVPLIAQQASNLSTVQVSQIYETLEEPIYRLNRSLLELGLISEEQLSVDNFKASISNYFKPAWVSNFIGNMFGIAGNLLIGIFSVLFISFFFLKERNLFTNFILALVPNAYEEDTVQVIEDITRLLRRYFSGILLQITIITIYVSTLLTLFGIQNGLLIAFFAAVINVIPYVGPIIGGIFGLFITISSNLNVDFYTVLSPMLVTVVIIFATMQLIDNFILQPFIFSNSVKAHPLEIFIVIMIAATLGGIIGMILAIPAYTVIRVVAKEFLNQFKIVQKITKTLD